MVRWWIQTAHKMKLKFLIFDSCFCAGLILAFTRFFVIFWIGERRVRELVARLLGAACAVSTAATAAQFFAFCELTEVAGRNLNFMCQKRFCSFRFTSTQGSSSMASPGHPSSRSSWPHSSSQSQFLVRTRVPPLPHVTSQSDQEHHSVHPQFGSSQDPSGQLRSSRSWHSGVSSRPWQTFSSHSRTRVCWPVLHSHSDQLHQSVHSEVNTDKKIYSEKKLISLLYQFSSKENPWWYC